jgi:N-acetylglucosamine-6-sulfatase
MGGWHLNRKEFLGSAGVALAGLSLSRVASGASGKPNLLVIMTDDQPYYTIPYMKAVASHIRDSGVIFRPYAYVSTPICGPARATLLTGKWSHNTGLTATTHPYAYHQLHTSGYESDTIATRLKKAGYVTFFGGKYQNGYDGKAKPPGWDAWFAMVEPVNKKDYFRYRTGSQIKRHDRSNHNETHVLSERAQRFVRDNAGSSQPWFAYVCPHAPHGPYFPASKHADEFERKPLRDIASLHEKSLADKPDWVSREAPYTRKERTAYSKEYRGMLRELQEVDDMVARIMSALADTNQRANTYIFFLTDNGYLHGEHGLRYKNTPYEEASRTPFIVRGPGVKNGIHSHVMVSHIDLPPTLLDLAGAPWSDLDGRSLRRVLLNEDRRPAGWRDEVFVEDLKRGWNMLRTPKYAYVEWNDGQKELYDMYADPYQMRSLHTEQAKADLISKLSSRLSEMKSCSGPSCRKAEVGTW